MKSYADLKAELIEISVVLEKFPESLRQDVYQLLVSQYLGHPHKPAPLPQGSMPLPIDEIPTSTEIEKRSKKPAPRKRNNNERTTSTANKKPGNGTPKIDGSLNLRPDSGPSFKEFYAQKKPANNSEFITVALYFLKTHLGIEAATRDQVFTCFKEAGVKVPEAFQQSFITTRGRYAYLELNDDGTVSISLRGENLIEHDLPREERKRA